MRALVGKLSALSRWWRHLLFAFDGDRHRRQRYTKLNNNTVNDDGDVDATKWTPRGDERLLLQWDDDECYRRASNALKKTNNVQASAANNDGSKKTSSSEDGEDASFVTVTDTTGISYHIVIGGAANFDAAATVAGDSDSGEIVGDMKQQHQQAELGEWMDSMFPSYSLRRRTEVAQRITHAFLRPPANRSLLKVWKIRKIGDDPQMRRFISYKKDLQLILGNRNV